MATELGKQLLQQSWDKVNYQTLVWNDLQEKTDEGLSGLEKHLQYFNRKQTKKSQSDETFTELNIFSIVGLLLFWMVGFGFMVMVMDGINASWLERLCVNTVLMLSFIGSACFVVERVVGPRDQEVDINFIGLGVMVFCVLALALLIESLTGLFWLGVLVAWSIIRVTVYPKNYYERKKEYV